MTRPADPCFVQDCLEPTDGLIINDRPTCIKHIDDAFSAALKPLHDALEAHAKETRTATD